MINVFIKYKSDYYSNTQILCVHEDVSEKCDKCMGESYQVWRKEVSEEIINHNSVLIKFDPMRENILCIHFTHAICTNCNLGWNDGYRVAEYELFFNKSLKTKRDLKIRDILT
jgi:hypothetical protein